jgi:hypothetical protein
MSTTVEAYEPPPITVRARYWALRAEHVPARAAIYVARGAEPITDEWLPLPDDAGTYRVRFEPDYDYSPADFDCYDPEDLEHLEAVGIVVDVRLADGRKGNGALWGVDHLTNRPAWHRYAYQREVAGDVLAEALDEAQRVQLCPTCHQPILQAAQR